jgi:hypothetical protein
MTSKPSLTFWRAAGISACATTTTCSGVSGQGGGVTGFGDTTAGVIGRLGVVASVADGETCSAAAVFLRCFGGAAGLAGAGLVTVNAEGSGLIAFLTVVLAIFFFRSSDSGRCGRGVPPKGPTDS